MLNNDLRFRIEDSGIGLVKTLLMLNDKLIFNDFFPAKFKQGVYAVSVSGRLPGAVVRDLVSSKNSICMYVYLVHQIQQPILKLQKPEFSQNFKPTKMALTKETETKTCKTRSAS